MRLIFLLILCSNLLVAQTESSPEPIHHYKLNGNVKDSRTTSLDGQVHRLSYDLGFDGKQKGSVRISEAGQYIVLPINHDYQEKGMSISFWVYPETQKKPSLIFSQKEGPESPGWQFWIRPYFSQNDGFWDISGSGFKDDQQHFRGYQFRKWGKRYNTWHHISMIFSPDSKIKFYVNAVLVHESKSLKNMGSFGTEAPMILGNHSELPLNRKFEPFKGKLDNLKYFNTALEPEQVEDNFYREANNLAQEWQLGKKLLFESLRKSVYERDIQEGRPKNYCFFNNMNPKFIRNRNIAQWIGEKRFYSKPLDYDFNHQDSVLSLFLTDDDTLRFYHVDQKDVLDAHHLKQDLIFTRPLFDFQETDSVHLGYLEIHIPSSSKRYISTSSLSYPLYNPHYVTDLENISHFLQTSMDAGHLIAVVPKIEFIPGTDSLTPNSYQSLNQVLEFLRLHPDTHIDLSVHVSERSKLNQNLLLSSVRAKTIYKYLVGKSISAERLTFGGYGSAKSFPEKLKGKAKQTRLEIRLTNHRFNLR